MPSLNADSIILPAEFDVANITYGQPRVLETGGKAIFVSYTNKDGKKNPLILQTPEMIAPFGLGCWKNDGGSCKYTIDLSFKGMDNREMLKKLFSGLRDFEKKIISDAFANSQAWLKKSFKSEEFVEALSTPIVRFPKDKNGEVTDKYPPTFKASVPFKDGKFDCDVYDKSQNLIDLNGVDLKGARVTAIIQCTGLWVAGGKFGTSFKVVQMRVIPNQTIKGYAFKEIDDKVPDEDVDEDDDADDDNDNDHALAKEVIDNAIVSEEEKEPSEDELVESSEDELESKPVAKVVRKKTASKK